MASKSIQQQNSVNGGPRSVTRVLGLFGMLSQHDNGTSLAELSAMLNSPKSSLLLLLRPLVAGGYLIHENGRYRLGPAIYRLASKISSTRNLSSMVRPYIGELANELSESVYLAVIDRDQAVCSYIEGIDCQQAVRFVLPLGQARQLYSTAAGRVLLAWQEKAWLEKYIQKTKLVPATEHTITSKEALKIELAKIRAQGYAVTLDEGHTGATGIAAPIQNSDGHIWAALLVALPTPRFEQKGPLAIKALQSITHRASGAMRELGGNP